ncbi:SDR family oxidoreductase [Rariglobus hedericola]|uniref:SDR family oxidoreductase n=1 Tax=Rariglobus hedericola TaxID=2597822 RepID=A0A556QLA7_9BACT|nr:SDR family NAD(P)-dependent oxidoreductase [Rariglobus hedericola]TSJ77427.1 SDR family oxidoreductase [Rariglobus hedericola]
MNTPTLTLHGKTALVTGAGSGIGKATALMLAEAGACVGVLTHNAREARSTAREITAAGHQAIPLVADVSDEKSMKAVFASLKKSWGQLDIVMANAGINGLWAPIEEIKTSDWDETLGVNLRGTFLTVKLAVPLMKKKGGSIIVVSSVNGTRMFSNTGASAYATSKAGQVAFARMIALELAKHSIRVNTICPGAIETNIGDNTNARHLRRIREPVRFPKGQVPLTQGKPGHASQVAQLALFLASDHSSHITGTEVFIDGAQSLLQG